MVWMCLLDNKTMWRLGQVIIFSVVLVVCLRCLSSADIYKYVDENGVIHYSDYPKHSGYKLYIKTGRKKRGKEIFSPSREWMMKYAERVSLREGVDPALVKAVMKAESNFKYHVVSRKGAKGVMQLLPASFPGVDEEEMMDPIKNIELGVKHLKKLLKKYNGNVMLAVAAYNAGEGAVSKYGGVPPFDETRRFVDRVMKYYRAFRGLK